MHLGDQLEKTLRAHAQIYGLQGKPETSGPQAWPWCSRWTPWRGGYGFASTREEPFILSKAHFHICDQSLQQKQRHGDWMGPSPLVTLSAPSDWWGNVLPRGPPKWKGGSSSTGWKGLRLGLRGTFFTLGLSPGGRWQVSSDVLRSRLSPGSCAGQLSGDPGGGEGDVGARPPAPGPLSAAPHMPPTTWPTTSGPGWGRGGTLVFQTPSGWGVTSGSSGYKIPSSRWVSGRRGGGGRGSALRTPSGACWTRVSAAPSVGSRGCYL